MGREAQGGGDGLAAAFQAVGRRQAKPMQAGGVRPRSPVGSQHGR
jgi:hypothetical protein